MRRQKPELRGSLILEMLDLFGDEFDHEPASRADHMIVVRVVVMVFVIGLVVAKSDLAGESRLRQQPQRPIDRRMADRCILFLNEPVKVLDRQVFLSSKERLHYQLTLIGTPQAGRLNMFKEYRPFVRKFVLSLRHLSVLKMLSLRAKDCRDSLDRLFAHTFLSGKLQ